MARSAPSRAGPVGETPSRTATDPPLDLNLRTHKRAVYEKLRDMIVAFELPPGERLVETELAARLGVSKTPVREALSMLESDGLAEVTPYRGAIVKWLSINEMKEQGFLVDALEMPAYPIVVERITDDELVAVGRVAEQLKRARRDRDEWRFGQLAGEIHTLIFACVGYPRLQQMIRMVLGPVGLRYDKVLVYPYDESWDLLFAMAIARYEAIRRRDAEGVARVVREYRARMLESGLARAFEPDIAKYFRND